jgi:hypothetical protein
MIYYGIISIKGGNKMSPNKDNTQINIAITSDWKIELKNLARIYSVEEETTLTYLDLMRRGIKEKYDLNE